jgi:hypothetical protein
VVLYFLRDVLLFDSLLLLLLLDALDDLLLALLFLLEDRALAADCLEDLELEAFWTG